MAFDEEIPYRSAIPDVMPDTERTMPDEMNYDTLRNVGKILQDALDALAKDFNAFKVSPDKTTEEDAKLILRQIEVRQGVYDILAPVVDSVTTAMQVVDEKYKNMQR